MSFGAYFWAQAMRLALSQIWANKMRAGLTALGIIVGVASVTAVIAALTGLKSKVLNEFESIGANRLFIFPNRPDNAPRNLYPWEKIRLKPEEAAAIRDGCPHIKAITPVTELAIDVEFGVKKVEGISAVGIWPDWHQTDNRQVMIGRQFSQVDEDSERQVCLINDRAIEELELPPDPVGQNLTLGGRRFLIVGVVETLQSRMFGMGTQETEVFIPFSVAAKLQSPGYFIMNHAITTEPNVSEEAKSEVTYVLRRMRGLKAGEPDTFQVEAIEQYVQQFTMLATAITAIAGGIVGISLLVGGIGIMNIMLVSVSERTREIGLRKAVGATPTAILLQFLLEAVTICFVGGAIGVGLGEAMALALSLIPAASLAEASVPWWAVVLSFLFSAGVGVVFGMWPAVKASRLDPIEALRHE
ncbi:MAG: FtsX-like permease family protein [Phycisphaerales bacterium]|nr:FtsX-like permease family protein [Phycisphaerales bacterium]